jgi:hypothetical protein
MTMRKAVIGGALFVATSLGVLGAVQAGSKAASPVFIEVFDFGAGAMSGDLGATRNGDGTAYMGCTIMSGTQFAPWAMCEGYDGKRYVTCHTEDPEMIKAVGTLNGDSYLAMNWAASGQCSWIFVENSSTTQPKQP